MTRGHDRITTVFKSLCPQAATAFLFDLVRSCPPVRFHWRIFYMLLDSGSSVLIALLQLIHNRQSLFELSFFFFFFLR